MRDHGNRSRLSKIKGQRQLQTSRIFFGKMSRIRLIYPRLLLGLLYPLVSGGCSLQQPPQEQHVDDLGYFQFRAPNEAMKGVIIGAPHGSFDEHTGEMVEQVSYRTGLAAVIAKGFTPTECGGWRINVNRPTESRYPSGEIEIDFERAQKTYHSFKAAVLSASQNDLRFVYRRSSKRPAKCD
jgi:hypothetical protein